MFKNSFALKVIVGLITIGAFKEGLTVAGDYLMFEKAVDMYNDGTLYQNTPVYEYAEMYDDGYEPVEMVYGTSTQAPVETFDYSDPYQESSTPEYKDDYYYYGYDENVNSYGTTDDIIYVPEAEEDETIVTEPEKTDTPSEETTPSIDEMINDLSDDTKSEEVVPTEEVTTNEVLVEDLVEDQPTIEYEYYNEETQTYEWDTEAFDLVETQTIVPNDL